MSKGLGQLQRRILEVCNFSKTLDEVARPGDVQFCIRDVEDCPVKMFAGQELVWNALYQRTWKQDNKPAFTCSIAAPMHLLSEAKKTFRQVEVEFKFHFVEGPRESLSFAGCAVDRFAPEIVGAAAPYEDILPSLYPDLFGKDHRVVKAFDRDPYVRHVIPDDIKKAKASARVLVSRAITSLEKRGILARACVHWSNGYRCDDNYNTLFLLLRWPTVPVKRNQPQPEEAQP